MKKMLLLLTYFPFISMGMDPSLVILKEMNDNARTATLNSRVTEMFAKLNKKFKKMKDVKKLPEPTREGYEMIARHLMVQSLTHYNNEHLKPTIKDENMRIVTNELVTEHSISKIFGKRGCTGYKLNLQERIRLFCTFYKHTHYDRILFAWAMEKELPQECLRALDKYCIFEGERIAPQLLKLKNKSGCAIL